MNREILIKEFGAEFARIYDRTAEFTMTSPERMFALYNSVDYVVRNGIAGDFVECGVWRGGSAMVAACTFLLRGDCSRNLFLFDTFTGMSRPGADDIDRDGNSAITEWVANDRGNSNEWCYASVEEVERNILSTGYPPECIRIVRGDVLRTLPHRDIGQISILRLDTDWYESTRHELETLLPMLSDRGILIIDDYGHWLGARKAVDEFFAQHHAAVLLNRIDTTGRLVIKTW